MSDLASRSCRPLPGGTPALSAAQIDTLLKDVPGWRFEDGAITRTWTFPDFHRTMAFVNAVAWIAHAQDHHPDMAVSYGRCTVHFNTHSIGGISENDFICAARIEALSR